MFENSYIMSFRCLEGVWVLFGGCLEGSRVSGYCLEGVLMVSLGVSRWCLKGKSWLVKSGQVKSSRERSSRERSSQDRSSQDRLSQDRSSQDKSSQEWTIQVRSGQVRMYRIRASKDWLGGIDKNSFDGIFFYLLCNISIQIFTGQFLWFCHEPSWTRYLGCSVSTQISTLCLKQPSI